MTRARARAVLAMVERAPEGKARRLYEEVYGARPAESVPAARVRASVQEALRELVERPGRSWS